MDKVLGGVSYYPDHWPKADWERDMRLIKESGLDIIRFGEFSWNWFEPGEGTYDFKNYDSFMDLAHKLGLRVILCTPTAAPPEWFFEKYPDAKMLSQYGRIHDYGRHMVCMNHPDFLRVTENTILQLAGHFKEHPALEGWQIDNEPNVGESVDAACMYDYNPYTVDLFRDYLRKKYHNDLNQLNALWYNNFWSRSYTSWEQIDAPRRAVTPSLWLDWMRFRQDNVAEFVQWQLRLLKSVNKAFVVGTNVPECGPVVSTKLGQDYWGQVRGMDYIGTDIYCYVNDHYRENKTVEYNCDMINSVAKHHGLKFWITESQGGPHLNPWRFAFYDGVWDAEFLERTALKYVEHGAERILFFLWRPVPGGREFGMNGLVDMDGTPTERSKAIKGIFSKAGKIVQQKKTQAYIHYSQDSLMMSAGFDPDLTGDSCYHGWYNLLTDCGYRVEFLNDKTLHEKSFHKDDLLVLPFSIVINEKTAEAVKKAVDEGIKVLAGYSTGFYNQYACCNMVMPGFGLDQTFGFRLKAVDYVNEDKQSSLKELENVKIGPHRGVVDIRTADIVCCSTRFEPVILRNKSLFYFAFNLGAVYEKAGLDEALCRWFKEKIASCGIKGIEQGGVRHGDEN